MSFKHSKGDAFPTVLAEHIQIPLEAMKRVVIENFESAMPGQAVAETDIRTVNGREVLYIRTHGTVEGVPLEYMVYVISGRMGTIQLFTFTGASRSHEFLVHPANFDVSCYGPHSRLMN
jgi:hypothetical protein